MTPGWRLSLIGVASLRAASVVVVAASASGRSDPLPVRPSLRCSDGWSQWTSPLIACARQRHHQCDRVAPCVTYVDCSNRGTHVRDWQRTQRAIESRALTVPLSDRATARAATDSICVCAMSQSRSHGARCDSPPHIAIAGMERSSGWTRRAVTVTGLGAPRLRVRATRWSHGEMSESLSMDRQCKPGASFSILLRRPSP